MQFILKLYARDFRICHLHLGFAKYLFFLFQLIICDVLCTQLLLHVHGMHFVIFHLNANALVSRLFVAVAVYPTFAFD